MTLAGLADVVAAVAHAPASPADVAAVAVGAPPPKRGCPWFASQSAASMVQWARSELDEIAAELVGPQDDGLAVRLDAEVRARFHDSETFLRMPFSRTRVVRRLEISCLTRCSSPPCASAMAAAAA